MGGLRALPARQRENSVHRHVGGAGIARRHPCFHRCGPARGRRQADLGGHEFQVARRATDVQARAAHHADRFRPLYGRAARSGPAESLEEAKAGAELVAIDFEELPCIVSTARAADLAAPVIYPEHGSNVAVHWENRAPDEIDAMCAEAGLSLVERHGSWQKTAFDDDSARHVSVYRNLR